MSILYEQGKTIGKLKTNRSGSQYTVFNQTNNEVLIKIRYKKKNAEIINHRRSFMIKKTLISKGSFLKNSLYAYTLMDQQMELAEFGAASWNDLIFKIRVLTNDIDILMLYIFGITIIQRNYVFVNSG